MLEGEENKIEYRKCGTPIFKATFCRKSSKSLRRFCLRGRKLMFVMSWRRDHFKVDKITCSIEYQREVKTMCTPKMEDSNS